MSHFPLELPVPLCQRGPVTKTTIIHTMEELREFVDKEVAKMIEESCKQLEFPFMKE